MNWGQLKAAVSDYLEARGTTFTANFPLYARLTEEDIHRQVQLPLSQQTSMSVMFTGNAYLSTPIDWFSTHALGIATPQGMKHLLPKEQNFLDEAYPDDQVGEPRFYAIFNESFFKVAPRPDADYAVTMKYFSRPASITAGDNETETWLSKYAENAMLFGMLYHGYIFEKGDQDVAQMYKGQFDKAISDLKLIAEGRDKKDSYRTPDQRIPV